MKIFLDAGHNYSEYDTGASGLGLKEQDITWAIAQKCGDILYKNGIEVKFSRPNLSDDLGVNLSSSLSARTEMSNNWGSDYFVSIHCNAGGGTGTETWIYETGTVAEKLAQVIDKKIVAKLGLRDRGIKTSKSLYVLKNTNCPSVLVETAFIDTLYDNELLKNKQGDFASAIAEGIIEYTNWNGIEKQTNEEVKTVEEALKKLQDKGVINSPDYWANAVQVVKYLDELLINMANKL